MLEVHKIKRGKHESMRLTQRTETRRWDLTRRKNPNPKVGDVARWTTMTMGRKASHRRHED